MVGEDAPSLDSVQGEFQRHAEIGTISEWAVPQQIELVSEIPKTSVGKIDKKKLREQYG